MCNIFQRLGRSNGILEYTEVMISQDINLDQQLKFWVLLPISCVMVLVGLLRISITILLKPNPKLQDYKELREKAISFRENCAILTAEEFESRRQYYVDTLKSTEYHAKKEDENAAPANPLTDASTNSELMNMAKDNLMNFIPQTLIMGWVNYFFAGFVIMKMPFPLTDGFKAMLQNDVATPDLSVRYVSSISWYFVNLLGLRPVYSLMAGEQTSANELINQNQQPMPSFRGPGAPKASKIFSSELENIQITNHESIYDGIADRIISQLS